uniref:Thioredoxin domain-containing protein 11 n=1 Tax=Cacopsylla melanoneura TaxID=428564 RepID=A0A8D8TM84_9HEMI
MLMLLSENDLSDTQEDEIKTDIPGQESNRPGNQPSTSNKKILYWNTQSFLQTIMSKEFFCLILTLLVYYAMFVTSLTKINKVGPASLFFTNSSCVIDHYEGNLAVAMKHAFTSDVSMVLLYAPWDADSQLARHEFDMTCRFYSKQVKFLAVNCWHPGSSCRSHFSKLTRYPAILVYVQSSPEVQGIQYKGLLQADHMIHFLNNVLSPIQRVDSVATLSRVKANNDGLVVLCADLTTPLGSRLYKVFYSVSLKFLEYDVLREVKFLTVLNSQVPLYLTKQFPSLVLVNFNNSVDYKGNFTEDKIIGWILNSLGSKPIAWINLSGTKSLTLNYYLRNETSLVLFTPRNLLRNINIYYNLLKIIAADFHKNCATVSSSAAVEDKYQILINYLVVTNIIESANHKTLAETCEQLKLKIIEKIISKQKQLEVQREEEYLSLKTVKRKTFANETVDTDRLNADANGFGASYLVNVNKETGVLFPLNGANIANDELFNTSSPVTSTTFVPKMGIFTEGKPVDKYSIMNLLYENSKQMCKILRLANRILGMPDLSQVDASEQGKPSLSGELNGETGNHFADCVTNKSINFLSIDSKRYRYFLDNLNIDIDHYRDETLAIIVDVVNDNENIYLLDANITRDSLVLFVRDYLDDKLTRYRRSNDIVSESDRLGETVSDHSSNPSKKRVVSLNRQFDSIPITPLLSELTASNFYSLTHNSSSSILVFFYSKYCGLCPAYSHILYVFSFILSHVKELSFMRVDSDTNDLPYPFVPHALPSVLLFPANASQDSLVFDRGEPFTQTRLLAFLLRGIHDLELRMHIYLAVCLKANKAHAFSCLQGVHRMLHAYLLKSRLALARTYGSLRHAAGSSLTSTFRYNMKVKKYLVRIKYYKFIQHFIRNHFLAGRTARSRRKVNHYVHYLYSVYTKCRNQIQRMNSVHGRLNRLLTSPQVESRQYRLKEEL